MLCESIEEGGLIAPPLVKPDLFDSAAGDSTGWSGCVGGDGADWSGGDGADWSGWVGAGVICATVFSGCAGT